MGKPIKGGTGAFDLLLDSDMLKTENAQPQKGARHSFVMVLSL